MPEFLTQLIYSIGGTSALLMLAAWLFRSLIKERLAKSVAHEFDRKLERHKKDLENKQRISQERWKIKRDVCLKAMRLIDQCWQNNVSKGEVSNLQLPVPIDPILIDVADARSIHSELSVCCEDPEIVNMFINLISAGGAGGNVSMGQIDEFRNLVRRELEFGESIPVSDQSTWIVDLHPDIREKLSARNPKG